MENHVYDAINTSLNRANAVLAAVMAAYDDESFTLQPRLMLDCLDSVHHDIETVHNLLANGSASPPS